MVDSGDYSTTMSINQGAELDIKPLQEVIKDLKSVLGGFGDKVGGSKVGDNKIFNSIKRSMDKLATDIRGSNEKSSTERKKTNNLMSRFMGKIGVNQPDIEKELAGKLPNFGNVDKRLVEIRNEVRELKVSWGQTDIGEEAAAKKSNEGIGNVAKKISEGNDEIEKSDKKENVRIEELKGKLSGGLMDLKGSLIPMIGIPLALGTMIGLMEKSSGVMGATFEVLQTSFVLMFKPFGDFIGSYFLPMAVSLIRFSSEWQIWAEEWKKQWAAVVDDVGTGFEEGLEATGPDAERVERFNQALDNFSLAVGESMEAWTGFKDLGYALGVVFGGLQSGGMNLVNNWAELFHHMHMIQRDWQAFLSELNANWAGTLAWVGKVQYMFSQLKGELETAWGSFVEWFSSLGLTNVFSGIVESAQSIIDTFKNFTIGTALNMLEFAIETVKDAFIGFYNWLAPWIGLEQIEVGKDEQQGPQIAQQKEPTIIDSIVGGLESAWEGLVDTFSGSILPQAYGDDGMLVYTEDGSIKVNNPHEIFPYLQNQTIPTDDPNVRSAISGLNAMFEALGIDIRLDTIDESVRGVEHAVGIIDVGDDVDWEFQFDRMVSALTESQVEDLQETYTTEDIAQAVAQGLLDSAALERIVQVTQLNKQDILDRVFQIQSADILSELVTIPGTINIDTSAISVNTGYDSIYTGAILDKDGNPIGLNPDYQALDNTGITGEESLYMDSEGNLLPPGEIGPYMQDPTTGDMVVTPLQDRQIIDDTGQFDDLLTEATEGLETELKGVQQSLDDFMMENDITINQMSFDDYMNATPEDMEKMGEEFRSQLGEIEAQFGKGSRQAWEFVSNWSEGWSNLNEVQVMEYNNMVEDRNKIKEQVEVLEGTVDEAGNVLVPGLNDLLTTAYAGKEFSSLGELAQHATREGDHNIVRHIVNQLGSVGLVDEMREVLTDTKPESAIPEWMYQLEDHGVSYQSETKDSDGMVYSHLTGDERKSYNESRALDAFYRNMAKDLVGEQEFKSGMYDDSIAVFESGLKQVYDVWTDMAQTGLIYGMSPEEYGKMDIEDQRSHKEEYLQTNYGIGSDEFDSARRDVDTAGVGDYDTLTLNTLIDTGKNIEGAIVSGLSTPRSQEGVLSYSMMQLMGLADISGSPRFPGKKVGGDNVLVGEHGQVINRDYTIKEAYIDSEAFSFMDGIENAVYSGAMTVDQATNEIIRFFEPVVKENMEFRVGESRAYDWGGMEEYITYQVEQAMRGEDARSYQLVDVTDLLTLAGINEEDLLERQHDPSLGGPETDKGYVLAPEDSVKLYEAETAKAENKELVMNTIAPMLGIDDAADNRIDKLSNIPEPMIKAIMAMDTIPKNISQGIETYLGGTTSLADLYSDISAETKKANRETELIGRYESLMGRIEPGTSNELIDKWGDTFHQRLNLDNYAGADSALNQMEKFINRLAKEQKDERTQVMFESSIMDNIRDAVRPYTSQLDEISAPIQDLINAMYETTMSADVSGYMDAFEALKSTVNQEIQIANVGEIDTAVDNFGGGVTEFNSGVDTKGDYVNEYTDGVDTFGDEVGVLNDGITTFEQSTSQLGHSADVLSYGTELFDYSTDQLGNTANDLNAGIFSFGNSTESFSGSANSIYNAAPLFGQSAGTFSSGAGTFGSSVGYFGDLSNLFGVNILQLAGTLPRMSQGADTMSAAVAVMAVSAGTNLNAATVMAHASNAMNNAANKMLESQKTKIQTVTEYVYITKPAVYEIPKQNLNRQAQQTVSI